MKRIALVPALMLMVASLSAQVNYGADYYYLGEYGKAQSALERGISADPADANFYLGEIAFAQDEPQQAEEYYGKALAADANNLNARVAGIKLIMKSDPAKVESDIKALQKQNKKSAPLAVAIGRAYLDNGMTVQAAAMADEAKGFDKKYPAAYILAGDIIASGENPDVGLAVTEYEQAKSFDPNYMLSYMKLAQIYERRNLSIAVENLKAATQQNPDYVVAEGMLGRIYTTNGFYPEAIAALTKHFEKSEPAVADIERMARAYYFGEPAKLGMDSITKYAEAAKWIDKGLAMEPNHFVLNRYKMYLDNSTGNFAAGITDGEKFFTLRDADSTYITSDYITYGDILKNSGRVMEAIAQYDKAAASDSQNPDTYKNVSELAREIKHYGLAAEYYQKMMECKKAADPEAYAKEELVDVNMLGTLYYQAGTTADNNMALMGEIMKDAAWQNKVLDAGLGAQADSLSMSATYFATYYGKYNLIKGEEVFKQLIELAPESYTGYLYMARLESALYPGDEGFQKSSAREYYEKTLEMIDNREGDMTPIMERAYKEAITYMAVYYVKTDDMANAKVYAERLLGIDPANPTAIAIIDAANNM